MKDNDQAIVTPTAEGFISVPTFNFGQVGVAGSTQQHSLKKPLIIMATAHAIPICGSRKPKRIELNGATVATEISDRQLANSDPLIIRAAPVSSFSNYNQPTELKNAVGTTSAISLNANNTATRIIANHNSLGVISISWTSPSTMSNLKCQPTKGSRGNNTKPQLRGT